MDVRDNSRMSAESSSVLEEFQVEFYEASKRKGDTSQTRAWPHFYPNSKQNYAYASAATI